MWDKDVVFVDYDGNAVYGYSLEEAKALKRLPGLNYKQDPSTSYPYRLGFDGWNYTLDEVKSLSHGAVIGAVHYPYNYNITNIFIHLESDKTVFGVYTVGLKKDGTEGDLFISWGDGVNERINTTSAKTYEHTYSKSGDYVVSIESPRLGILRLSSGRDYVTKVWLGTHLQIDSLVSAMFSGMRGLKQVLIPEGYTTIPAALFAGSSVLESVTIPRSVRTISTSAFSGVIKLKALPFPKNVRTDGVFTIGGLYFLKKVVGIDSPIVKTSIMAGGNYSLTRVFISDEVTTIATNAFNDCVNLKEIDIPSSVTTFSNYSFKNCRLMRRMTLHSKTPPNLGTGVFAGCYPGILNIIVPKGSLSNYKNDSSWSEYSDFLIESDE